MTGRAASLRFRLRSATQALHNELDVQAEQAGFFAHRDGYHDYLQAHCAARHAVEPLVAGAEGRTYCIMPLLLDDMGDLVLPTRTFPAVAGRAESTAALQGRLYVLAGSCLGATLLFARAQELGFTATCGARHLAQQAAAAREWPRFVASLDALKLTEAEEAQCIAAAQDTFRIFHDAFRLTADA